MNGHPILMTEEYWASSMLSPVRYTGSIRAWGIEYVIVNKDGKDIFQCSAEAAKTGREKAIEPGEPCDLIDRRYIPIYKEVGRETFIKWLEEGLDMPEMKERLKTFHKPTAGDIHDQTDVMVKGGIDE